MNWYAVYTKPRQEDHVASQLAECGIEVLNPKIRLKKYRGDRLAESVEPFFPCYLFATFDKETSLRLVKYTKGVKYVVGKENPIEVPEAITATIREKMQEDHVVILRPDKMEKGDRVKIRDGAFKDFYGIFERATRGFERVVVLLEAMCYRLELSGCSLLRV